MTTYNVSPPEACTWSDTHDAVSIDFGVPLVPFIVPDWIPVVPMGKITRFFVGMTPAATTDKIRVNTDWPSLAGETLVHECVHAFQRKRMGALSYDATYIWQCVISFFRGSHVHVHYDHEMEREAREVAKRVIVACYKKGEPLDIEAGIKQVTGW
jgi:hypothetical protein